MAAKAKDWWEAIKRRHPTGVTWDQFRQAFTDRFYPRSYQDAKIEEFFRLEQRSLTVTDYEQRFSELVKLVPMIQENEEHKCERFMAGLNGRIKVHLAWASQNNFGELVEAALRVERTVSVLTQGRPDSKRGAPSTSQPGTSQSSRKKERSGPAVEAQDEEQHLARDPFDHQQPQEVVDLQDHLFHCALHVRGGISESAG